MTRPRLLHWSLTSLAVMSLLVTGFLGPGFMRVASAQATTTRRSAAVPASSFTSPDGDPLLLVHGFQDTCDYAFNHTDLVPNTGLNAKRTIEYLENNGWSSSALDLIGYYDPSVSFTENLINGTHATTTDGQTCTHNLQSLGDQAAVNRCAPLLGNNTAGTPNDPIEHLGCLLAWYIYNHYGGYPVDILAHSMGGLIVRDAIGESGHATQPNYQVPLHSNLFPPAPLNVHVVVTVGTPHGGVWGEYYHLAQLIDGTPQELVDMKDTSDFMNRLDEMGEPQGLFGTYWAVMASSVPCGLTTLQNNVLGTGGVSCDVDGTGLNDPYPEGDGVVQADSALSMPANLKILYGEGLSCIDYCPLREGGEDFNSGGLQYSHEANTCTANDPNLGTFCLTQPFYLNDGTSGYTEGWVCNLDCTHGGAGGGGMDDMAIIDYSGPLPGQPVLHSLAEIVAIFTSQGSGAYEQSSSASAMVALTSGNTFVVIGNTVYKYDLGTSGTTLLSPSTSGTTGPDYIGAQSYSSAITAIAANEQYLFVALSNHRVVKTTLCGSGNNMCALSDGIGSSGLAGYSYWVGDQDYSVPVTGLAATPSTLYTNLAGGGIQRTVKTTLCGSGNNMCALSDSVGTGGLSGYSYWVGRQDWAWAPTAIAANDSLVLTTIGSDRVCKTTPGSSGNNVFALSDGTCTGNYPGYHYWIGYQDWSTTITNLAIDGSHIWWGLGSQGRLVQTTWCGTGGNICALSDGLGTQSLSGYSYLVGRQDWCAGYNQMGVASINQFVDALFITGTVIRVVQANAGSGANMFATSDCTGTGSASGWNDWIGSQDFTV